MFDNVSILGEYKLLLSFHNTIFKFSKYLKTIGLISLFATHGLVSLGSPSQSSPFPWGGGLVQVLVLSCIPSLQSDQSLQSENPPSAPNEC